MATREIKTRFALEGEQKYKSTMKDAANAVKVLNSQQKLAKAQFQQTGDAEKYNAQQAEILKKKIEEQKKAVEAAEQAIKALTENGVAQNSRQMQDWQIKLNNAKTALSGMETELQNLGQESTNAEAQTESLGESLQSLDKKASVEMLISGIGRVTSTFESAVGKVKELGSGLVNSLKDAATWADDLATQAIVYGTDVETLQRMRNAADLIDTDVETIIRSQQKLESAMKSGSKETEAAFAQFGVHTKRYGEFRDWEDVFWEVGDAMMHMTDGLEGSAKANAEVERDTSAMKLFGKSWRELIPLFTAGREEYQRVMQEGSIVNEEDVGKLTELDDALQNLQIEFNTLKETVLAQLAPALTELGNALTGVLKEMNEYLQTDEGKAKLAELSKAVEGFFSGVKDIDVKESLDLVKNALQGMVDALSWIRDNKDSVAGAIGGIVAAWAGLKAISGFSQILELVNGWKGVFGNGGKAAAAAAPAASAAPAAGTAAGGLSFAGMWAGLKTTVGNWASNLMSADPTGSLSLFPLVFQDHTAFGRSMTNGQSVGDAWKAQVEEFKEYGETVRENMDTFQQDWEENVLFQGVKGLLGGDDQSTPTIDDYADALKRLNFAMQELEDGNGTTMLKSSVDELKNFGSIFTDDVKAGMEDVDAIPAEDFAGWMQKMHDQLATAAMQFDADLSGTIEDDGEVIWEDAEIVGENIPAGVASGINANSATAVNAVIALGNAVTSAMRTTLAINSPSKVMAELGEYVSDGFAEGIMGGLGTVGRAAERMAGVVSAQPMPGYSAGRMSAAAGAAGGARMIDISLMLGPEKLTEVLVPLVDDALGAEVNLLRR